LNQKLAFDLPTFKLQNDTQLDKFECREKLIEWNLSFEKWRFFNVSP
jgi:hypothetical protein